MIDRDAELAVRKRLIGKGVRRVMADELIMEARRDPKLSLFALRLPAAPRPGDSIRGTHRIALVAPGLMGWYAVLAEPVAGEADLMPTQAPE